VTVEAGADVATHVGWWVENQERSSSARLSGVPGGLEANYPSPVQTFDERYPFACLAEALDLDSHRKLLSERVTETAESGAIEETV